MKLKTVSLCFSVFLPFWLMSCQAMPKQVWVEKPGLYPEGLEYDVQRNNFLVTSLKEGTVGLVDKTGKYTRLVDDPNMISAIGIRIDKKRNRILVANSDPGVSIKTSPKNQKKIAGLGIFNLSDGKLVQYVNLSALLPNDNHFANDIALDEKDGTAYVTDSFSPVIYKVTADGQASVFLKDQRFTGDEFNLNGIAMFNGYLIAAKSNDGTLFKIPLTNPENFTDVSVDYKDFKNQKFPGADGLLKDAKGNLVISSNGSAMTVYKIHSDDEFKTAKVIAAANEDWRFNTTGILVCDKPYVLNAELGALFGGKPDVSRFEIRKVHFNYY